MSAVRLLRLREVTDRTALSRATIWRMYSRGEFPKPIRAGNSCTTRWIESEVEDWIAGRIRERDEASQN
jgi:prophage regulatory protein